jgi:hypothetical protein
MRKTGQAGFKWLMLMFLVGVAAGSALSYLCLLLFNLICRMIEKPPIAITWWQVLPMGIWVGISYAILTRQSPFGD